MHGSQNVRNVISFLFESLQSSDPFYHSIYDNGWCKDAVVHSTFFLSALFETLQSFNPWGIFISLHV